jgi:hypothetical protein
MLLVASMMGTSQAESPYSVSAFSGLDVFSSDTELGNSWVPNQVPTTSVLVGVRIGRRMVQATVWGRPRLEIEAEFKLAPSFTTNGAAMNGATYFAPVFGWRAHAMGSLQLAPWLQTFALVGSGGESIASTSPYMADETDPLMYWGVGVRFAANTLSDTWRLRIDGRHGLEAGRVKTLASTFELHIGIETRFGGSGQATPRRTRTEIVKVTDNVDDATQPCQREFAKGLFPKRCLSNATDLEIKTAPNAEPTDADHDGIVDSLDKCVNEPEDRDGFADDDGCPDADNDNDGIADAADKCPLQPETKNNFVDDDGCPDQLPASLLASTVLTFSPGKAKFSTADSQLLLDVASGLREATNVSIAIVSHDDDSKSARALRQRRFASITWFLSDHGIGQDRVTLSFVVSTDQRASVHINVAKPD